MLSNDTQKRLVLLSDGGDNAGDVQTAIQLAQARDVPIEVVQLGETVNDLAQLSDLRAPSTVRKGQVIQLEAVVESQAQTPATLRILAGSQPIAEQQVELQPGRQTFEFSVRAESDGFTRYSAELALPDCTPPQNNHAPAHVYCPG